MFVVEEFHDVQAVPSSESPFGHAQEGFSAQKFMQAMPEVGIAVPWWT